MKERTEKNDQDELGEILGGRGAGGTRNVIRNREWRKRSLIRYQGWRGALDRVASQDSLVKSGSAGQARGLVYTRAPKDQARVCSRSRSV